MTAMINKNLQPMQMGAPRGEWFWIAFDIEWTYGMLFRERPYKTNKSLGDGFLVHRVVRTCPQKR